MKKLLTIITILWFPAMLLLTSCQESETTGEVGMMSYKFEHEGYHYILFHRVNNGHISGVILDPSFTFQEDTLEYNGSQYIKVK